MKSALAGTSSSTAAPAADPSATPDEGTLLHWLGPEALPVDEIARRSGLPIAFVSSTLQVIELKGLTHQAGPMQYLRT